MSLMGYDPDDAVVAELVEENERLKEENRLLRKIITEIKKLLEKYIER